MVGGNEFWEKSKCWPDTTGAASVSDIFCSDKIILGRGKIGGAFFLFFLSVGDHRDDWWWRWRTEPSSSIACRTADFRKWDGEFRGLLGFCYCKSKLNSQCQWHLSKTNIEIKECRLGYLRQLCDSDRQATKVTQESRLRRNEIKEGGLPIEPDQESKA